MARCRTILQLKRPVAFADVLLADFGQRRQPSRQVVARAGLVIDLELPAEVILTPGNGLLLDDGRVVLVRAAPEPVLEIRAITLAALAPILRALRDAGHVVEVQRDHLAIKPDDGAEAIAAGFGAFVTPNVAPFEPEGSTPSGLLPR